MDFLDPEKKRARGIKLAVGYVLVAILIGLATLVMLYQAYGYSIDKHGQLIQNGLVFVSSNPNPADIYLNGQLTKSKTNTRLLLPAGQYTLEIKRTGYRNWQRAVGVEGGSVERFDYPFLFPTSLQTTAVKPAYPTQPGLVTQSPDRRWLLVEQTATSSSFDMFDLNNRKLPSTVVSIPTTLFGSAAPTQKWQLAEWSTDNRHVLLKRLYAGGSEYIMVDTQTPASSLSLTSTLDLAPTDELTLLNKQFDQFYVYNAPAATLGTESLTSPTISPVLNHVLAYKTFGTNVILYATDTGAPAQKVVVRLQQGSKNVLVRSVTAGAPYLLNLTQFNGVWYVAAGASVEDKVFVYKDPIAALAANPDQPLVPLQILKVTQPNYLEFSANARFIAVENGPSFSVYDILTDKAYAYQLTVPIGAGAHATWMDGNRLIFASGDKVMALDYDDANQQTLSPAQTNQLVFFDRDYKYLYAESPATPTGEVTLTRTALTVPPAP